MSNEYKEFIFRNPRPWCWACGRDSHYWPSDWHAGWRLERAHVASGSGACLRVEDVRCIIILCSRCHMLHGREVFHVNGEPLPCLTNSNVLWLKRERDPDNWDPGYLQGLWTGRMPEPEPPDAWFVSEYSGRRDRWNINGQ